MPSPDVENHATASQLKDEYNCRNRENLLFT